MALMVKSGHVELSAIISEESTLEQHWKMVVNIMMRSTGTMPVNESPKKDTINDENAYTNRNGTRVQARLTSIIILTLRLCFCISSVQELRCERMTFDRKLGIMKITLPHISLAVNIPNSPIDENFVIISMPIHLLSENVSSCKATGIENIVIFHTYFSLTWLLSLR